MSVVQPRLTVSNMRRSNYKKPEIMGKNANKSVCNMCKKYFSKGESAYSTAPGAYRHVDCGVV